MKRKFLVYLSLVVTLGLFSFASTGYLTKYVETSAKKVGTYSNYFISVTMKREESGKRIKAKYFAYKNGHNSIYDRIKSWSPNKKVICITSAAYVQNYDQYNYSTQNSTMDGITIDDGVILNKEVSKDKDALVIVYATGGIVVSDLKEKDLQVVGNGLTGKKLNIRGSISDRMNFIKWAKAQRATVYQTHLLVMNDQLKVYNNGSGSKAERRFLVAGYDSEGKLVHTIIHDPNELSLYQGAKNGLNYVKGNMHFQKVVFMVNLDTGVQNSFKLYNANGSVNDKVKGRQTLDKARNLLVYYYE